MLSTLEVRETIPEILRCLVQLFQVETGTNRANAQGQSGLASIRTRVLICLSSQWDTRYDQSCLSYMPRAKSQRHVFATRGITSSPWAADLGEEMSCTSTSGVGRVKGAGKQLLTTLSISLAAWGWGWGGGASVCLLWFCTADLVSMNTKPLPLSRYLPLSFPLPLLMAWL